VSRGMPSDDVDCIRCGRSPAWPVSQICRSCIAEATRNGYTWTPERDAIVRRTYAVATQRELKKATDEAVRLLNRSRATISRRAAFLGCQWVTKRLWE
jgi:hypothetical protein